MSDIPPIRFHEIFPKDVEGLCWREMERSAPFDRVPVALQELAQVYSNGHSSTGECVTFWTDSTAFHTRLELGDAQLGEPQFNVCAFSGVDLYFHDDTEKRWRWAATYTNHECIKDQHPEYTMLAGIERTRRLCRLYLPQRNRLLRISIGLDEDASFEIVPPREENKLVYYGTSIAHGAYCMRAGLGVPQILARNLDMPLINQSSSGACRLEPQMAEMLSTIDHVKCLVIDPMHNLDLKLLNGNLPQFLNCVCTRMPHTTIVLLTSPRHLQGWYRPQLEATQKELQRLMRKYCLERRRTFPNLHFIDGQNFYGCEEVSTDGVHPNDNAMWHMATILTKKLKRIL